MRGNTSLGSAALLFLGVVACSEATRPNSGAGATAVLSALSSTSQTLTVGDDADPPAVSVRDSAGRPLQGVDVTFRIVSGTSIISSPTVKSNSDGVARLSRWIIDIRVGLNAIIATAGGADTVHFSATGTPGPLASLVRLPGADYETGLEGEVFDYPVRVLVTDRYGNGIEGIQVRFTVEAGGGHLTGDVVYSDSLGHAQLGSWTFGNPGTQNVAARAGSLPPALFISWASPRPIDCPSVNLPLRVPISGELSAITCRPPDGRTVALYRVNVPTQGAFTFTMTSAAFDTQLELRDISFSEIGRNSDSSSLNSSIKAILRPGTYYLVATSASGSALGTFSITAVYVGDSVSRCEEVFVVRGVVFEEIAEVTDCRRREYEYSDRYRIYLLQGASIEFVVADGNYTGPDIESTSPTGQVLRGVTIANYKIALSFQASVTGYYTFHVGLGADNNQEYKLTIR